MIRKQKGTYPRILSRVLFVGLAGGLAALSVSFPAPSDCANAPEFDPWVHVRTNQRGTACTVRVGVSSFAELNPNHPVINATLEHLAVMLPQETVCVNYYPTTELLAADLRKKEVDFFIASSGFYRRTLLLGAKDLSVVVGPHAPDPNRAEGSVFLITADRTDIRDLEDLRGKTLVANLDWGFSGFQTALREVVALQPPGARAKDFFRTIGFVGHDQKAVLEALLEGRADAGALKTCLLEEYEARRPEWKGKFRVVHEIADTDFACRTSTRLYPNWVFAATPRVPTELARRTALALLEMPRTEEGLYWGIGTDFSEVDGLMRDLRLGPYEILDEWSLRALWERYKVFVSVLLTLVAGGLLHAWRTERLVRRRTAQLTAAHAREKAAAREARLQEERLALLQKRAAVGQMSNMVAHELRQPLAAILAYGHGLERLAEAGRVDSDILGSTLVKITCEADRANGIVERVRQYARSKSMRRTSTDARTLFEEAVRAFRLTERAQRVAFEALDETLGTNNGAASADGSLRLWVDELEAGLALQNLLRNAADAALSRRENKCEAEDESDDRDRPRVRFSLSSSGGYVLYRIEDNGPRLSDEAFARLSMPLTSEKPEGLGLGLGIARSIAEAHGGQVTFVRLATCGLAAHFALPIETSPEEHPDKRPPESFTEPSKNEK